MRPFTSVQIKLLETFADQAVIAIENVRLFQELKESLEQQTATSEILGVIASSPTDIQPVLDALTKCAHELCDADKGSIYRWDGDAVAPGGCFRCRRSPRSAADKSNTPRSRSRPGGQHSTGELIHIHDVLADA